MKIKECDRCKHMAVDETCVGFRYVVNRNELQTEAEKLKKMAEELGLAGSLSYQELYYEHYSPRTRWEAVAVLFELLKKRGV